MDNRFEGQKNRPLGGAVGDVGDLPFQANGLPLLTKLLCQRVRPSRFFYIWLSRRLGRPDRAFADRLG
ncbi:MAG: hypothetical protein RML46_08900 [Anaerolineae bacterium]|nr:hypothetical protein [Anaerolineae bacterium]MDW8069016.1 hypothetical protein [Anaerolineae bacterium]